MLALVVAVPGASAATAVDAPTKVDAGRQAEGRLPVDRNGPPVVLITGLGGSMDGWDPTWLDAIAAAGHRVVIFDNEGVGRSTAARGPLTIRRMGDTTAG